MPRAKSNIKAPLKNNKKDDVKKRTPKSKVLSGGNGKGCSHICYNELRKLIEKGDVKKLKNTMLKNLPYKSEQINSLLQTTMINYNDKSDSYKLYKNILEIILKGAKESVRKHSTKINLMDSTFNQIIKNYDILVLFITKTKGLLKVNNRIINKILNQTSFSEFEKYDLASLIYSYWFGQLDINTIERLLKILDKKPVKKQKESKLSQFKLQIGKLFSSQTSKKTAPKIITKSNKQQSPLLDKDILRVKAEESKSESPYAYYEKIKKRISKPSSLKYQVYN